MPEIRSRNHRKCNTRIVFHVVRAMPIARQRFAKHIPGEANAPNNRGSIAMHRRGKQALPRIQAIFRGVLAKWI
jgi:hypothetical protein